MEENLRYLSQSIQRAIDILLAFTPAEPEWGITELSETLDLPKSTVHRLVVNLEMRGLLERDPATEKYRLGVRLFELGTRVWHSIDLQEKARPHLEELARQTRETTVLSILSGGEALYLDKVDSTRAVRAANFVGQRRPLHCTAVGRVLLAWLPHHEVVRTVEQKGLAPRTPNTITEPARLYEELAVIREQHYAIDDEEFEEDLCCVATPIMDHTGAVVAAIGISGPTTRVNSTTLLGLIELMLSTAEAISKALGYTGALALAPNTEAVEALFSQE